MTQDFMATFTRTDASRVAAAHSVQCGPWSVTLNAGDATVITQAGKNLWAVIKGCVYDAEPGALLDAYERHGADFPRHLEGQYAALILDGHAGRILAITDRVGSRALYAAHDGTHAVVSTRPDVAPLRERPLSMAGISSLLIKGNLIGGLTLHEGVTNLRRACVHELGARTFSAHEYWPLTFLPNADRRTDADLELEFVHLLSAAVTRRLNASGDRSYLSLSGGYDSRGLLNLMAAPGQTVRTVSYTLSTLTPGSDAPVAQRLAAQYGAQHTTLTAYRGSVLDNVQRNVSWGGGAAPLCDEADAWAEFAALNPSDVFVGDHAFDFSSHPLDSRADQLLRQKVPPSYDVLSWLQGSLSRDTFSALESEWHTTLDSVLGHAGAAAGQGVDGYRLEMALMLDVNVAQSLLPWRDRFAGHSAQVHTPYLDGALLDFTLGLPLPLLARKALFRRALHRLDPQLMQVPLARSLGYVADWKLELIAQRDSILASLKETSSPVDDLIPPDVVKDLLLSLAPTPRRAQWRGNVRQTLGRLRRTPLGLRLLGPAPIRKTVDATTFLRRVLVLRTLTADHVSAMPPNLHLWSDRATTSEGLASG